MNNKKIALFDLDDTLLDIKEVMYQSLREEYGSERTPHWSTWTDFKLEGMMGISFEELIEVSNKHKTFIRAKPHLFAPFILKDLRERGWHVIILTARGGFVPDAYGVTEEYLELNGMEYDELIVTKLFENKMDSLVHHEHMTFSVDDQVNNCHKFRDSGKFEHVFLQAQTHNRGCTDYVRLHNLYQLYHHLGIN